MEYKFRKYLNIKKETITETKKVIFSGYFKMNFHNKYRSLMSLNKKLSKIYNIPINKIKIVCPERKTSEEDKDYIILYDSLSLATFLAKFKEKINNLNNDADKEEVLISRDCFDWALSVIYSSAPDLVDVIMEKKEEFKDDDEKTEDKIQLKINSSMMGWW